MIKGFPLTQKLINQVTSVDLCMSKKIEKMQVLLLVCYEFGQNRCFSFFSEPERMKMVEVGTASRDWPRFLQPNLSLSLSVWKVGPNNFGPVLFPLSLYS